MAHASHEHELLLKLIVKVEDDVGGYFGALIHCVEAYFAGS